MRSRILLLALTSLAFVAGSASADSPTMLGVFKNWTAASYGSGDAKVCYAIAHPTSSLPKKAKRDGVGFMINDWPGHKAVAQPQIVPGYDYKEGSTVTAEIGADKFTFFPRNDKDGGSAWIKNDADESRLVDAMKRGSQLIVTGISKRGTLTKDTYSLAGIGEALDKIHASCGA